jgi:putative thiamine transport system permease protein
MCTGAAVLGAAVMGVWSLARSWWFPAALPSRWTLDNWSRHLDNLADPFWTTVVVGCAATGLALVLVLGCLENEDRHRVRTERRALWLLYVPLLVPQIGFLFGLQVVLVRLGVDGGLGAVVWSHLLFVLPYVFLALADPWRSKDERYARTAACLGCTPRRVFLRVKLPMLLRPVLFAAAVGFAVSVAQYLPTVFAGAGRQATLTTEAVTLSTGADRRVIGVYAFVQAALPMLVYLAAVGLPGRRRE